MIMKKILFFVVLSAIFFSCSKDKTTLPDEEVLSPEEMANQHKAYFNALVGQTNGYFFNVAGAEAGTDSVFMHIVFKPDGKLTIQSATRENLNLQESSFSISGDYNSILKFEGNSIFTLLKKILDAPSQFIIDGASGNTLYLKRGDGYNTNLISLRPFTPTLKAKFDEKQDSVYDVLQEEMKFAETKRLFFQMVSDNQETDINKKRFKVFAYGNYGFHWTNIDTVANRISFEFLPLYKNEIGSVYTKYSSTHNFTYFPGGIALNPVVNFGGEVIDSIFYDDYDATNKYLNVVKAGTIEEAVKFGYHNNEAFYYHDLMKVFDKVYIGASAAHNLVCKPNEPAYATGDFLTKLQASKTLIVNPYPANNIYTLGMRVNNSGSGGGEMLNIYSNVAGFGNLMIKVSFVFTGKNTVRLNSTGVIVGSPAAGYTETLKSQISSYFINNFFNRDYYVVPFRTNSSLGVKLLDINNANNEMYFEASTTAVVSPIISQYTLLNNYFTN